VNSHVSGSKRRNDRKEQYAARAVPKPTAASWRLRIQRTDGPASLCRLQIQARGAQKSSSMYPLMSPTECAGKSGPGVYRTRLSFAPFRQLGQFEQYHCRTATFFAQLLTTAADTRKPIVVRHAWNNCVRNVP
jgi:hypothetical protein